MCAWLNVNEVYGISSGLNIKPHLFRSVMCTSIKKIGQVKIWIDCYKNEGLKIKKKDW